MTGTQTGNSDIPRPGRPRGASLAATGAMVVGCAGSGVLDRGEAGGGIAVTAGAESTGAMAPAETDGESGSGTDEDASTTVEEAKFDIGGAGDLTGGGDATSGCAKIDFLFVVDNSGSMDDEQAALVNSFPGFIASIQDNVMAQDYHIMVVDTDASGVGSTTIACSPDPDCCEQNCAQNPTAVCNDVPCSPPEPGCGGELGGGRLTDADGDACGVTNDGRFMDDTQAALSSTFSCLAQVGTNGDGDERPMEAMVRGLTTLQPPGQCNEGFLRDDAILVVTFITDEEEESSEGNPNSWKAALVDAKGGNEQAIVMLGIVGDTDIPASPCAITEDADAAPILRDFATSFPFGSWGSVCAGDYAPFFDSAVGVIDGACDMFEPEG